MSHPGSGLVLVLVDLSGVLSSLRRCFWPKYQKQWWIDRFSIPGLTSPRENTRSMQACKFRLFLLSSVHLRLSADVAHLWLQSRTISNSFSDPALAVATHLSIFLVKSSIENAIATSLTGVFYGPVFPACLSMANDILPDDVHMVAMSLM